VVQIKKVWTDPFSMSKNFYHAIFYLGVAALMASCSTVKSQNEVSKVLNTDSADASISRARSNEEVYAGFAIGNIDLRLVNRNGRCTLLYAPRGSKEKQTEKNLDVGMVGPCNFVGTGNAITPQHFIYGQGGDRRAVFLITGGPPSVEFPHVKDKYMPHGCGTWLAKIYVYDSRVQIAWLSDKGPPICPSAGGLEEVFFST
jgi:hypothetical protein